MQELPPSQHAAHCHRSHAQNSGFTTPKQKTGRIEHPMYTVNSRDSALQTDFLLWDFLSTCLGLYVAAFYLHVLGLSIAEKITFYLRVLV